MPQNDENINNIKIKRPYRKKHKIIEPQKLIYNITGIYYILSKCELQYKEQNLKTEINSF